jgi:hypothetical protein
MTNRTLTVVALAAASVVLASGAASAAPAASARPNDGDILQSVGLGLSGLTSDCGTVLGPLTGANEGVLTNALLKQGTLLGDLTDPYSGSLSNLTYPALVGACGRPA